MSRVPAYNREEFVTEWLKAYKRGDSQRDLARKLKVSAQAVNQRAFYCRSIGINLPSLHRLTRQKEIAHLNALIEKEVGNA